MEETKVTEQSFGVHLYLVTEYECTKCGATFLNRSEDF